MPFDQLPQGHASPRLIERSFLELSSYCHFSYLLADEMRDAVVNTKGAVGKTTNAVHLATMLDKQGKTLLIDGDLQASEARSLSDPRSGDDAFP